MATTLSQFYSDKGQALQSVSQRGSLAAQAGIQGYTGSAAQNNQLLNFMQTSGTGQTGTQNLQSIQPPTIPAATALGNTQPTQLPQTPQGTSATELSGASAGYLTMPTINSLNQLGAATQTANQNAQTAQNDYMSQFTGLLNQMQNRPGELEQQYQIQKLSQDAMKAKANYDSVELAYRRKKESAMNNTNLTKEQASNVISDIERKEASQKADIAIDYNLKQGLLSNAKELMNKQLELELEPMKLKVDFYKDNRDRFDKILDKTEMRQYDYIQKKEERAYQAAKESANRLNDLKMQAIKDGLPYDQVKNIKSIEDYAKLTGQKPADILSAEQAKDKVLSIDSIINNKTGKNFGVGANIFTRGQVAKVGSLGIIGLATSGAQKDFVANTEAVLSGLTLDALKNAKAQGATFGALSEGELGLLQNSASVIQQAKRTDKNGKVIGYDISQSTFDREMDKIKKYAIMDYERRTGKPYTTENDPAGIGIDITMLDPAGLYK